MSWTGDLVATALHVGEKVYRYGRWVVENGPALVEDRANKRLKVDYSAVVSHLPIVRAATVGALPAYTAVGGVLTADTPGALPAVDGVVLGAGDLVLVRSEADEHADHGPYEVMFSGSATASWVLRRAGWFNAVHNARAGAVVAVAEGDTWAGVLMRCRAAEAVELGVTSMGWDVQGDFAGATIRTSGHVEVVDGNGDVAGSGSLRFGNGASIVFLDPNGNDATAVSYVGNVLNIGNNDFEVGAVVVHMFSSRAFQVKSGAVDVLGVQNGGLGFFGKAGVPIGQKADYGETGDSTGGTIGNGLVDVDDGAGGVDLGKVNDNFATMVARLEGVRDVLRGYGLME